MGKDVNVCRRRMPFRAGDRFQISTTVRELLLYFVSCAISFPDDMPLPGNSRSIAFRCMGFSSRERSIGKRCHGVNSSVCCHVLALSCLLSAMFFSQDLLERRDSGYGLLW